MERLISSFATNNRTTYRLVKSNAENRANFVELVTSNDLARWCKELGNDFEALIMEKYAKITTMKHQLYELGTGYASMSGSGAAVFGVFEDAERAKHVCTHFEAQGFQTWME